ncbi:aminoacyl-histidine dipeptidase [Lachnospira multipara]|uniref:aminoacyl-histidine dipeptidase n=1 Tax=Lachnospira multipara TaxID=28051 RepID=UPI000485F763|nr:aminoacyl-histidine dipeptidase [Lachnospira multipara]
MGILTGLQPEKVFYYFEEITKIPHGSTDTKRISDYLVSFAKEHNLKYIQDELNNVIIFKDASAGYENSDSVIIQGHMDMVCEKEDDCDIDFKKDALRLELNDGIISAKGTTLGGDDGIAVAYALAVLDDDTLKHPALEVVITVDEEIGMLGAADLDTTPLKSKLMINIDSEEEGILLASCAGGMTATLHLPTKKNLVSGTKAVITVDGLLGGHSGTEINKGRANANKLVGRVLYALSKKFSFNLVAVNGGLKDNAIPRASKAELVFAADVDMNEVKEVVSKCEADFKHEYKTTDSNVAVTLVVDANAEIESLDTDSTKKVITALMNLPLGIQSMSFDIEGLVQTSLNLGILETKDDEVAFSYSVRSSVESEKQDLYLQLESLATILGGNVTTMGEYPAWEYNADSKLRSVMVDSFKRQYGREPEIQAIHAGLECGLFAGKIKGLDAVSFGPDMKDVHTPKESMDVASVARSWNYLVDVLASLK